MYMNSIIRLKASQNSINREGLHEKKKRRVFTKKKVTMQNC
jgi:hypothetical protein